MHWRLCLMMGLLGMSGVLPVCAQLAILAPQPAVVATPAPVEQKRPWGPEQATGVPDTPVAGDCSTAWASLLPDAGPEWLQVEYARAVALKEVRIRESYNPGAVSKVTALAEDGKETTLWEGTDPTKNAPADFVVKPVAPVTAKRVKIYLDTTRVPGWNEIDAVELVGTDDTRQWAIKATASSTYAEQPFRTGVSPVDEFAAFIGLPVICHLPGEKILEGVLQRSGQQFLVIRSNAAHTYVLVNKAQLVFVEIKGEPRPEPPVAQMELNERR